MPLDHMFFRLYLHIKLFAIHFKLATVRLWSFDQHFLLNKSEQDTSKREKQSYSKHPLNRFNASWTTIKKHGSVVSSKTFNSNLFSEKRKLITIGRRKSMFLIYELFHRRVLILTGCVLLTESKYLENTFSSSWKLYRVFSNQALSVFLSSFIYPVEIWKWNNNYMVYRV